VSTICTIESISCLSWTENSENRKHLKQIFKCQKPDSSRCRPKVDLLQHIQSEAFLCTCVARTSIHPGTNFGNNVQTSLSGLRANPQSGSFLCCTDIYTPRYELWKQCPNLAQRTSRKHLVLCLHWTESRAAIAKHKPSQIGVLGFTMLTIFTIARDFPTTLAG